jgi:hypothetical protein
MGIQRPNITGNAGSATKLQTARNIGGVAFDGTGNINLPGVNAAGNQSTTGNAATATTAAACSGIAAFARQMVPAFAGGNLNNVEPGVYYNYSSVGSWINAPVGMDYGSVYDFGSDGATGTLKLQIAADVNHDTETPTRKIWFRTSNNRGFRSDWKEFLHAGNYQSFALTAAQVTTATAQAQTGAVGTYAMLRNFTNNQILPGQTAVAANLSYANAAGIAGGNPPAGSVWMCMGYASSNSEFPNKDMATTLFLRIS